MNLTSLVAQRAYRDAVAFIEFHGWRRIEEGDGWWWNPDRELLGEYPLGEALQVELEHQGVDTRIPPRGMKLDEFLLQELDVIAHRPKPGMFLDWTPLLLLAGSALLMVWIVAMVVWLILAVL